MTSEPAESSGARLRGLVKEMAAVITERSGGRPKELARIIWREPFAKRTWSEFAFMIIGVPLASLGIAFVAITLFAGVFLTITFFGLGIIALSLRGSRGIGGLHRQLARGLLDEDIEDPEPFIPRRGFFGWLQSTLRDRTGWRAMAYIIIKVPLAFVGILAAFAFWWDAFCCITFPIREGAGSQSQVFGLPRFLFGSGFFSGPQFGFWHGFGIFAAGILLLFAAPWSVRAVVGLDRLIMRVLLS
jgi:hypothetical protein